MSELKRLDVTVIYATHDTLFIDTNKYKYEEADEYVTYILDTIRGKELYKYMHFMTMRVYTSLLWYNHTNFTGQVRWVNPRMTSSPSSHWVEITTETDPPLV